MTKELETMPRELRIVTYIVAGLVALRVLVLAVDGLANTLKRRSLYAD